MVLNAIGTLAWRSGRPHPARPGEQQHGHHEQQNGSPRPLVAAQADRGRRADAQHVPQALVAQPPQVRAIAQSTAAVAASAVTPAGGAVAGTSAGVNSTTRSNQRPSRAPNNSRAAPTCSSREGRVNQQRDQDGRPLVQRKPACAQSSIRGSGVKWVPLEPMMNRQNDAPARTPGPQVVQAERAGRDQHEHRQQADGDQPGRDRVAIVQPALRLDRRVVPE
jgi:hypothetical protein